VVVSVSSVMFELRFSQEGNDFNRTRLRNKRTAYTMLPTEHGRFHTRKKKDSSHRQMMTSHAEYLNHSISMKALRRYLTRLSVHQFLQAFEML